MASLILSFDTEDFVTPESDDALGFLAEELARRDLPGCFALVGDKARALRERGRADVLARLADHEVDYHSNDHHFFPPLATTIEGRPWDEAVAWVLGHESRGLEDLEELTGHRPVAWVRTDCHWTPQSLHAFRLLGIRVYAARHFARGDARPLWYMNLLTVPYSLMLDSFFRRDLAAAHLTDEEALRTFGRPVRELGHEPPEELAEELVERLAHLAEVGSGEGVIVLGAHPCLWVCETFYDLHNIKRRGRPPAKERWAPAPLLPADKVRRNQEFFRLFLDRLPGLGLEVITYGDLLGRYAPPPGQWVGMGDLRALAWAALERFASASVGARSYSAADTLAALCYALARHEAGALPERVPVRRPLGPLTTPRPRTEPLKVCNRALLGACRNMDRHIEETGVLPPGVDVGDHHFTPGEVLSAAAQCYLGVAAGEKPGGHVLRPGPDCPEEQQMLWDATVSSQVVPRGYDSRPVLELGRLQSWTLKWA